MPKARPKRLFFRSGFSSSGCTTRMRSRWGGSSRSGWVSARARRGSSSLPAPPARCAVGRCWRSCCARGSAALRPAAEGAAAWTGSRAAGASRRGWVRALRSGSGEASPMSRRTLSSSLSSSSSSERPWKSNTFFSSLMPQPPLRYPSPKGSPPALRCSPAARSPPGSARPRPRGRCRRLL